MIIARRLLDNIDALGRELIELIEYTFNVLMMVYLSFRATLLDQAQGWRTIFGVVSAQIFFTGVKALPIITVLALSSGAVVILQSTGNFALGGSAMMGNLLIVVIVRELGPLMTALIVIARSGTAVASELGNMKVNRETEALEAMGINPMSFVIFPRILGGIISVVCLAFYFNVIALLGGYFVTVFLRDIDFNFYLDLLSNSLAMEDVLMFLLKNCFSGAIIFVVSSYQGLSVIESPHEVPQVTAKAVVHSIVYVVAFNLTATLLFYLNSLMNIGVI